MRCQASSKVALVCPSPPRRDRDPCAGINQIRHTFGRWPAAAMDRFRRAVQAIKGILGLAQSALLSIVVSSALALLAGGGAPDPPGESAGSAAIPASEAQALRLLRASGNIARRLGRKPASAARATTPEEICQRQASDAPKTDSVARYGARNSRSSGPRAEQEDQRADRAFAHRGAAGQRTRLRETKPARA